MIAFVYILEIERQDTVPPGKLKQLFFAQNPQLVRLYMVDYNKRPQSSSGDSKRVEK